MSRWRTVSRDKIPSILKIPGVFALYVEGKLRYVGQGFDVRSKIIETIRNLTKDIDGRVCLTKVSYSTHYFDWVLRKEKLVARLSPEWNKVRFTFKDLRGLEDKGNGYLEPPDEFKVDAGASWMGALRSYGLSNHQIADYINKAQTKKRWTPIAVQTILRKYDKEINGRN